MTQASWENQVQLTASPTGTTQRTESATIWSASEGQAVNFWVYIVAALTFFLIVPIFWAGICYWRTSRHRYQLTDQRFLEYSGVLVKRMETLELYRVVDIAVQGTVIQSLFGLGQVKLVTKDQSTPEVIINAIAQPVKVATLIRNAVEQCRVTRGVRTFDA